MAKLFVGQRVRKVRKTGSRWEHIPIGAEGIVAELGPYPSGHRFSDGTMAMSSGDCLVIYDGFPETGMGHFRCLEPILPEGHQSGEEGQCEALDELLKRCREFV